MHKNLRCKRIIAGLSALIMLTAPMNFNVSAEDVQELTSITASTNDTTEKPFRFDEFFQDGGLLADTNIVYSSGNYAVESSWIDSATESTARINQEVRQAEDGRLFLIYSGYLKLMDATTEENFKFRSIEYNSSNYDAEVYSSTWIEADINARIEGTNAVLNPTFTVDKANYFEKRTYSDNERYFDMMMIVLTPKKDISEIFNETVNLPSTEYPRFSYENEESDSYWLSVTGSTDANDVVKTTISARTDENGIVTIDLYADENISGNQFITLPYFLAYSRNIYEARILPLNNKSVNTLNLGFVDSFSSDTINELHLNFGNSDNVTEIPSAGIYNAYMKINSAMEKNEKIGTIQLLPIAYASETKVIVSPAGRKYLGQGTKMFITETKGAMDRPYITSESALWAEKELNFFEDYQLKQGSDLSNSDDRSSDWMNPSWFGGKNEVRYYADGTTAITHYHTLEIEKWNAFFQFNPDEYRVGVYSENEDVDVSLQFYDYDTETGLCSCYINVYTEKEDTTEYHKLYTLILYSNSDEISETAKFYVDTRYHVTNEEDCKIVSPYQAINSIGDLNEDGSANVTDIIMLQKYLHKNYSFSNAEFNQADMNHDGVINVIDLALLKRKLLNQ